MIELGSLPTINPLSNDYQTTINILHLILSLDAQIPAN